MSSVPRPRRGVAALIVVFLLTLVALHTDCTVDDAETSSATASSAAATSTLVHLGSHLPAWDDCCAHDRHVVLDSTLPADPAKLWPPSGLADTGETVAATSWHFLATAVRGPPGPPPRTGRDILTHFGIARR
ncbi:putative copper homeostasis (lipo)protein LpqS [Nocardia africana]